jgi:hypothetical protein
VNRNREREEIEIYCRDVNKDIRRRWIVSLKSDMQEGVIEFSWCRQRRYNRDELAWIWSVFVHRIGS